MSASLRVSVDNLSNLWRLKNIHRSDRSDMHNDINLRRHNSHTNLSHSFNSTQKTMMIYNNTDISNSNESLNKISTNLNSSYDKSSIKNSRLFKRRSSSTSYLNEEDDYDDENDLEELKKFRRQLSLFASLDKNKMTLRKDRDEAEGKIEPNRKNSKNENEHNENSNSSDDCMKYSDSSDSDCDELYSIEEYDETLQTLDCDSSK